MPLCYLWGVLVKMKKGFDKFLDDLEEIGENPPAMKVKCDYDNCHSRGKFMMCYFDGFKSCNSYVHPPKISEEVRR